MKEKPSPPNDFLPRSKNCAGRELTGNRVIDSLLSRTGELSDEHGNLTRSTFLSAERYLFDFNHGPGWEQFDTDSDAWYFGVWVNPTRMQTLSYVEGDIGFMQCKDAESYDRELARLCMAYEPGAAFTTIDFEDPKIAPGGKAIVTRHFQDRSEFFIDAERGARFIEEIKAAQDAGQE